MAGHLNRRIFYRQGAVSGTFSGLAEGATINLSGVVFTISYVGGDGNDVVLTVMAVPAVPTTTTLTAAPNPTTFGTNVVLTATVVGASPTGTVQFKDGAANLGGPVALAAGAATFNTSTLTVGGHPITAVYSGDGGNLPSTSAPLTVIINLVPATAAVVSSVNPTVFGNSTTFTATVTGSNPTGTVQFKDGAVNLGGPVALSSGQATFSTSSLAIGVHPITVVYSGDATNTTAISPILTQTVANGSVPAPSVSIPTLSEWMLGVLGLMLAAVVFRHHRRLRRLG